MLSLRNSWCSFNMCYIYFCIWVSNNQTMFYKITFCCCFLFFVLWKINKKLFIHSVLSGLAILLCYAVGCIGTHFLIRYLSKKILLYVKFIFSKIWDSYVKSLLQERRTVSKCDYCFQKVKKSNLFYFLPL